jgi:hypothetical protein
VEGEELEKNLDLVVREFEEIAVEVRGWIRNELETLEKVLPGSLFYR